MIKAIFFDIDGTLVSYQTHEIPQSAFDALYQLKEKGIKVFIATGRGKDGLAVLKDFPFDGYITLKSGLGEYMLDVNRGEDSDGTNIQIYNGHSGNSQQFLLKPSDTNGAYVIATKSSSLTKVLDDSNFGKENGNNVCQWTYSGDANQRWIFEAIR